MDKMDSMRITVGDDIFFVHRKLPMKVMARSDKFAVASRRIDRDEDISILNVEQMRGGFSDIEETLDYHKDSPIYTIIDFESNVRGSVNLIFDDTDYFSESSCSDLINALEDVGNPSGISFRNIVPLEIDWSRMLVKD